MIRLYPLFFLAFCLFLYLHYLLQNFSLLQPLLKKRQIGTKQDMSPHVITSCSKNMVPIHLGFSHALADLFWIQLLQSANHEKVNPGFYSWEFCQLNKISYLDRNFEKIYPFGAAYLSVFRQDQKGALIWLENWVRFFPNDWKANSSLAYHLYSEVGDFQKASYYMLRAAQLPKAPSYFASLGVKLLNQAGLQWQALKTALTLYQEIQDPKALERLKIRIQQLSMEMQKQNWQMNLTHFRKNQMQQPIHWIEIHNKETKNSLLSLLSELKNKENSELLQELKLLLIALTEKPRSFYNTNEFK